MSIAVHAVLAGAAAEVADGVPDEDVAPVVAVQRTVAFAADEAVVLVGTERPWALGLGLFSLPRKVEITAGDACRRKKFARESGIIGRVRAGIG
jgi:hypothetical protein